jgi:hypothetical protein
MRSRLSTAGSRLLVFSWLWRLSALTEVLFLVVDNSKTERITKKGHREVLYRVSLKSGDGKLKLQVVDASSELLIRYPIRSQVQIDIGKSNQSVLTPEELSEEIHKAEDAEED